MSGLIRKNVGTSLLLSGIVLMWISLGIMFKVYGYEETWRFWHVPTMDPVFRDFQLIPGSAESFRQGFEPSIENPYDVGKRIFNYPAFWRLFFYTPVNANDTVWIVVTMLILYFGGVLLFPEKISIRGAILMLLVVFSPASMLLYERGNADLFVFFICASIVIASDSSPNWTAILIAFGTVVKMFPLFGLTVLLKEPKQRFWKLAASCVLFMVLYGILTLQSQTAAWNNTMRGDGLSYGTFVIMTRLGDYFQQAMPNLLSFVQWKLLFETAAGVLILFAVTLAVREADPLTSYHQRNLAAFRMGASIYLGTFLLGNNWDYRLAFLVFVVPQLSEWFYSTNKKYQAAVIGVVIMVLLSCWHPLLKIAPQFIPLKDPVNRNFIVDEFFNWLLVPGFSYLLAASVPEWLKTGLRRSLGGGRHLQAGKIDTNR